MSRGGSRHDGDRGEFNNPKQLGRHDWAVADGQQESAYDVWAK